MRKDVKKAKEGERKREETAERVQGRSGHYCDCFKWQRNGETPHKKDDGKKTDSEEMLLYGQDAT